VANFSLAVKEGSSPAMGLSPQKTDAETDPP